MSITVYPYKLTQRELEARLEPGLSVLPGQYLRFATKDPIFGQVREVRALPPSSPGLMGGYRLLIDLLHGTPSLEPQQIVLLNAVQMGREIQKLQEPIIQPLQLSPSFSAELSRLGALTVISGDDFLQKFDTLQMLLRSLQPHRRVVILDPLGVFAEEDGYTIWHAGQDVRLSLQAVGSKSFLDTFSELFAPGLRSSALRIVADHLPPMHAFQGFHDLLNWYGSLKVPLQNLILQNLETVAQASVFADSPEQMLNWHQASQQPAIVLNLSGLQEPWRGLFFREAIQALLEQSAESVVPVLLYPENYLPNLTQWIQKADEAEFKMIMLASPYVDEALLVMANNRFEVETTDRIIINGSLTLGLPLVLSSSASLGQSTELGMSPIKAAFMESGSLAPDVAGFPVYSSFNVPLMELEEPAAAMQGSGIEAPVHWLGEAADPADWSTPAAEPAELEVSPTQPPSLPELAQEGELESIAEIPTASTKPPALPIVDLAAPVPEPTPEFLSASQLSELLASSLSSGDMGGEVTAETEETPSNAVISKPRYESPAGIPSTQDGVSKPVADTTPSRMEVASVEMQESQGGASGYAVPEPEQSLLSADHFPPQDLAKTEPERMAYAKPVIEPSALPPFPTPEEYEREEFFFDLNPDSALGAFADESATSVDDAAYGVAGSVAQSLDEFADFSLPIDPLAPAQSPEFPPPISQHPVSTSVQEEAEVFSRSSVSAVQEGATILPDIAVTDQELHDTLDLIFPNYPHEGKAENESAMAAAAPAKPVRDEPMEIIQKYIEPPSGAGGAFQAGDRVKHPTYGLGVIQKVIPTEESVVLNITFDSVGKRLLDPALCRLTREAAK